MSKLIFETLVLECPHCQTKLDVRPPITIDNLIQCATCSLVSELHRDIHGYALHRLPAKPRKQKRDRYGVPRKPVMRNVLRAPRNTTTEGE